MINGFYSYINPCSNKPWQSPTWDIDTKGVVRYNGVDIEKLFKEDEARRYWSALSIFFDEIMWYVEADGDFSLYYRVFYVTTVDITSVGLVQHMQLKMCFSTKEELRVMLMELVGGEYEKVYKLIVELVEHGE